MQITFIVPMVTAFQEDGVVILTMTVVTILMKIRIFVVSSILSKAVGSITLTGMKSSKSAANSLTDYVSFLL